MLISKLYINKKVIEYKLVKEISSKLNVPIKIIYNQNDFLKKINKRYDLNDRISMGKQILYLTYNKGNFIKKCPGTRNYLCCNYFILHIASFCSMDCSYCILQNYFHPPIMQLFLNFEKLKHELENLFFKTNIRRIGTGEFTDSLIWDKLTGISTILIKKFSLQNKTALELKTKTTNINHLKHLKHNKKTILSWSINTPRIIKSEEKGTSSFNKRLEAASKCESWGYPLAFHIDPIIIYNKCEKEYEKIIEILLKKISHKNIVWISLGSFRYMTNIKDTINKRFPKSLIPYGEFIYGLDNKMRYFKPIRIKFYKHIRKIIKNIAPEICVYCCMEESQIWKNSMKCNIKNNTDLSKILDIEAAKKCKLSIN